jgi:hypothetical protein
MARSVESRMVCASETTEDQPKRAKRPKAPRPTFIITEALPEGMSLAEARRIALHVLVEAGR